MQKFLLSVLSFNSVHELQFQTQFNDASKSFSHHYIISKVSMMVIFSLDGRAGAYDVCGGR